MKTLFLPQAEIRSFLNHLTTLGTVYAPHKKGNSSFVFDKMKSPDDVILEYPRTLQSIKKYFLPPRETLLSFSMADHSVSQNTVDTSPGIFFAVHSYDMQAVLKLDYNFSSGLPEKNYLTRRNNCTFIGISFVPDKHHFSGSVGIPVDNLEGFDLFLDRIKDGYNIRVLTDRGMEIVTGQVYFSQTKPLKPSPLKFNTSISVDPDRLSKILNHSWNAPLWEEVAVQCVGCGTCNLVCPTCYCFNVEDDVDLTLTHGRRGRTWDGCILKSFAAVAGGENFRESLAARQRHRVYRKFKYISDETGKPWCVGCGRCNASCTAGISIVDIVNKLHDISNQNQSQDRFDTVLHKSE